MLRAFLVAVSGSLFAVMLVGCKANPPGKFETAVMRWTKHKITVQNKCGRESAPGQCCGGR